MPAEAYGEENISRILNLGHQATPAAMDKWVC
jgi:hypothetical protein